MSHWGLSDVLSWAEYGRFTGPVNRAANTRGPLSRGSATRALLRSTQQGICLAGDLLRAGHAEPETARAGDAGAVTGPCVAARAEDAAYGPGPWKRAKEREREKHAAAKGSAEGGKDRGREREKRAAGEGSAEGGKERGREREACGQGERGGREGARMRGFAEEPASCVMICVVRSRREGGREMRERERERGREGRSVIRERVCERVCVSGQLRGGQGGRHQREKV